MFETKIKESYLQLTSKHHYAETVNFILSNNLSHMPTLDQVAFDLRLSGKGLQLKLRNENTVFSQLRDNIRVEFAKHYLQNPTDSVTRICKMLGLSEPSFFYRAFKR